MNIQELVNNYVENNNAILQIMINKILLEKDKEIEKLKQKIKELENEGGN